MNKKDVFKELIDSESSTKKRLFYSAIYLFSTKGYANVGIRELCRSVNVKESSFYNHYSSKEELFYLIMNYFKEANNMVIFNDLEVENIVQSGDIRKFFYENMKKFSSITSNPLYHTVLQIILMECYTNEEARKLEKNNLYYLRKDYTEKIIRKMIECGHIKECNVELITAEYYYGLKGFFDEYLLCEVWDENTDEIMERISSHIEFYVELLKK